MTEQAILEAVQEIFRDNFDDDTLEITRATCADDIEDWDSLEQINLLTAIEKEAAKAGIVQNVLLEVNIGGEESKSGVSPEALWPLLDAAAAQEHIRVKGLMAIPPVNDDDAQNRRYLAAVHDLFVKAGERGYSNVEMQTLSMGMSGDYENAIREGATLVRIGTAIYGERDYRKR